MAIVAKFIGKVVGGLPPFKCPEWQKEQSLQCFQKSTAKVLPLDLGLLLFGEIANRI